MKTGRWMIGYLLIFGCTISASGAADYYLSDSGCDGDNGSRSHPWKSLEKISSVCLKSGDTVYFKKGDRFVGHLVVNGSGTEKKPILITSYGDGERPILTGEAGEAGGGDFQEAICVENNEHLVFDGLEIHNERSVSRPGIDDEDAYGIHIRNTGAGVLNGFVFRNVMFRNIYAVKPMLNRDDFNGLEVAGLRIYSTRNIGEQKKSIRNIRVENCFFTDIQRLGIHIKHGGARGENDDDATHRNSEIIVRNNEFHYLGGTSVLPQRTFNCLIENNLFDHPGSNADPRMPARGSSVWTWRCVNTVIQHNQCLSTRGYLDSHGIHVDHENVNTFVQYNYMEDCEGGFVEILGGNVNAVYRFNISVNDGWRKNPKWINSNHTIWISPQGPGKKRTLCDQSYIYNNTVFIDGDFTTAIEATARNTHIYNNIFCSTGGMIGKQNVRFDHDGTPLFVSNNLFSGNIDNRFSGLDVNPVLGDPKFRGSGTGAERFRLETDSPAIRAGIPNPGPPIPGAGKGVFKNLTPYPVRDFFENPVDLSGGMPVIGAGK